MPEEGEEVVGEDNETAAGLRSPEIVRDKAVHREVGLQLGSWPA